MFLSPVGRRLRRLRSATALAALLPWLVGWTHRAPIPVKVGQEKVHAKRLPFACITIGTAGVAVPIEKVTVENLDTHEEFAGHLGQWNNKHRDYPYGGDDKRRALSMAILQLAPGHYRLKSVEFTPEADGGIATLTCPAPDNAAFDFTVKPGCVNYVGSVIISANWQDVANGKDVGGGEVQSHFASEFDVERSEARDRRWAEKLIPCMASLPSQVSPLGGPEAVGASSVAGDRKPQVLALPLPAYPEALKAAHVSGKVVVDFLVGTDGRVQNAKIVSSPSDALSAAVLRATRDWRFLPAVVGGKLVTTHLQVPIAFEPAHPK